MGQKPGFTGVHLKPQFAGPSQEPTATGAGWGHRSLPGVGVALLLGSMVKLTVCLFHSLQ